MEFRELAAFVAVAEEGGMSAASRRLHISQPALSQTVNALERELGVQLLVRGSTGVQATEAGTALLSEARAILARHNEALRRMAQFTLEGGGIIRLGVPLELPPNVLPAALAKFTAERPETRVQPRHLSTAVQVSALRSGEIDVGLVREHPPSGEFDTMLVVKENLGVLLNAGVANGLLGPDGIPLDALGALQWVGFPRSASPAWYDELTAILRSHGIQTGPPVPENQELIAAVKFAAVGTGHAFTLAPENWQEAIPDGIAWAPLVGNPLVRRTWAVWPANSRRRDIGHLIAAFETPDAAAR
jgi:DNA-binding transcriptional LysR family regulator